MKYLLHTIFLFFFIMQLCYSQEKEKKDSLKYEIDEIVVIGTRSVEKIIDIPYSVFRVDKKELSYGKKVSAKDVLADVPGLFLQSRYGNHDLRISIRGFGTRSNSGVRGVRILQDGIPESEPDGETVIDAVDFTSLGGVEVVKGNLSSLYANAPGGVINFVTDLYFPKNFVTTNNQIGKFGYRQNGFKLGLKTNQNRFFLSYNYRNLNGYRKHSAENQHLVNAVYEAYIGEKSTLTILGNYVNGLIKLPGSLTSEEYFADPFQANPYAVALDFKRITKKGRLAVRYKTTFGREDQNEIEITGYGGIKELDKTDNDFYSVSTRYSLGTMFRFTNKSQVFNRKNILSLGMDFAHQSGPFTEFDNQYGSKGISVQNLYNPELSNIGFYFLNHLNIVEEKLDLYVSGRFDKNVFSKSISIPFGFTDTLRKFQRFTPKVGLNYKIIPTIAVYSSYGESFDFPALSELGNNPLSSNIKYSLNPDLTPQRSQNFELGIKGNLLNFDSEFMRKLFFEVTYFNYMIHDEIVPFVISQKTYFRNAAKTSREGVEIGFKSEPFEEIELVINYTITNFKYKDYKTTVYSPSGTTIEDYTGNFVPSVPKGIFNFILAYEFEMSEEISGLLIWDCDYIAKMYVNDKNTASSSPYFYGNVMAGINYSDDFINFIIFAGAGNIFDKRYSSFININEYYGRYFETGEPRNIYGGLTLSYKF